jgi:hypothetical protein
MLGKAATKGSTRIEESRTTFVEAIPEVAADVILDIVAREV